MKKLKTIPTSYRGYLFRSRLEARWAVFLDKLAIKWDYEPEGFELNTGRYLPDFLIKGADGGLEYWLEIKGVEPDQRDIDRALELSRLDRPVFIFCGSFSYPDGIFALFCLDGKCFDTRELHASKHLVLDQRGHPVVSSEYLDWPGFIIMDRPEIGDLDNFLTLMKGNSYETYFAYNKRRTEYFCGDAIRAARSARFEFKKVA